MRLFDEAPAQRGFFRAASSGGGNTRCLLRLGDRGLLRLRDMIKVCNETLAGYKAGHPGRDKFDNVEVIAARPAYSRYLLRELDDEIAKHVPLYKDYLEVLKRAEAFNSNRPSFAKSGGTVRPSGITHPAPERPARDPDGRNRAFASRRAALRASPRQRTRSGGSKGRTCKHPRARARERR